jgi:hypothetical protein
VSTRVPGRGALLRSLRGLLRRVDRFALHRARTSEETRWAARLADRLEAAFTDALETPGVGASLAAADRRAHVSAKTSRTKPPLRRAHDAAESQG